MPGWLFSTLAAKIAQGACVVLLTLLLLSKCEVSTLTHAIEGKPNGWRAQLETSKANLQTCRNNTAALETGIAAQNAAVEALASVSRARTADADKRALEARRDAAEAQVTVGRILAAKPDGDACVSALALVRGSVR